MGTISLFPLSVSGPLRPNHLSSHKTRLSGTPSWPRVLKKAKLVSKTVVFGGNPGDPKESMFRDENGVIDDMDGYLNYLSLEYDSVWDTKPSWSASFDSINGSNSVMANALVELRCQPWTITLTGVLVIASSWLILHSILFTSVILLLVCTWWYIFLYSYPKAYLDMIAERRKRVVNGVEDTFDYCRQINLKHHPQIAQMVLPLLYLFLSNLHPMFSSELPQHPQYMELESKFHFTSISKRLKGVSLNSSVLLRLAASYPSNFFGSEE
ncbi:hypothetical protein JRO89_XS01G0266200 [Xanthoceras sorbifolium]|uniref:DUF6737 domain-containing protein n=1 Tax=Xanthoceras sorbifolium TaxID=99658 RepID=A0ABQ8ILT8_9ROSI|nr:hypothetical protein JRO89_XS01G0266200 [Xanthoceras sorbifolium]